MKTKQQVVSEFRRTAILDAACTVFARKGYARGILDDIANVAGVAKGTVYLYFRSKKQIYKAVLERDMEALKSGTLSRIGEAATLREKIRIFALARIENAENRKEFFRIMDIESGELAYTRSQYRNWLREPVLRVAEAIAEASQRGEICAVPAEKVAWMIADVTRGTIQRRLMGQNETTPSEDADFLVKFIWNALKA